MPITRAGETPSYLEFALRYCVDRQPPGLEYFNLQPIIIPAFQRGIVWRRDNVDSLIESNAVLFGTSILAHIENQGLILVDGLQRFATATSLLNNLYPKVLAPTPSDQTAAPYFQNLKTLASLRQAIFAHNDNALRNHRRKAIRESYGDLDENIKEILDVGMQSSNVQEFATNVERMFLRKQIAIDPYYGFNRTIELAQTFITLNSEGVDLSPVDLLRAVLVDRAFALGWASSDVDQMENDFTDVFVNHPNKNELKALGNILYEGVRDDSDPVSRKRIFPNWDTLTLDDVTKLLDFVQKSLNAGLSREFPYLDEILESGSLPFAITVLHFYLQWIADPNKAPDFYDGSLSTSADLHLLLRAYYRKIADGSIGRIGDIAREGILKGTLDTVQKIADRINPSDAGSISDEPAKGWLTQRLREIDKTRAPRMFNACLLPLRTESGGAFSPFLFGRGEDSWNIDHLIAKKLIRANAPGENEAERLPNFSPLPTRVNKSIRNNPCSTKLGPQGPYVLNVERGKHTYIDWLVEVQYPSFVSDLDDQKLLVPNANPAIGDKRIEKLVDILLPRL
ncbi:DUF262 domain-containing protein [bacterium]|nr:DUF262 domain-containing protein [bacterium]